MTEIVLFPYQEIHVDSMNDVLSKSPFALDFSALGTGKTYTTSKLYQRLELANIIVVAPVSVKTKWEHMKQVHGINVSHSLSYNELRSVKGRVPKHGLLTRRDYTAVIKYDNDFISIDRVEFKSTDAYQEQVRKGVLLVLDEIQNIKNYSAQFQACQGLILEIVKQYKDNPMQSKSRVVLISGSPIDKKEHVMNLFKCLDIMQSEYLCERISYVAYKYDGLDEIMQYCSGLEGRVLSYSEFMQYVYSPLDAHACVEIAYQLFLKIFKKGLTRSMTNYAPANSVCIRKYNGFFKIELPEDKQNLRIAVEDLGNTAQFNPKTGTVAFHGSSFGAITNALMSIEFAKLNTFIRLASLQLFNTSKTGKVVICVSYRKSIGILSQYFEGKGLNTLILNGSQNAKTRGQVLELFQKASSKHRILICNIVVCNSGIDLDDKHGSYPRTVFVSPIYNTITLYQLCHRFQRIDSKSSPDVYMVYGSETPEHSIINSLGRKSTVMKETTIEQAMSGLVFPGDFPSHYECESMYNVNNDQSPSTHRTHQRAGE